MDGAVAGEVFDVVADPVVDLYGVVAEFGGFGADGGGELDVGGFGEVGGGGGGGGRAGLVPARVAGAFAWGVPWLGARTVALAVLSGWG